MSNLTVRQIALQCVRTYHQEGLFDADNEISKTKAKKFHKVNLAKQFSLDFFIVLSCLKSYKIILPIKETGKPDKLVFKPGKLDLILSGDDAYITKSENKTIVSQTVAFRSTKTNKTNSCEVCNRSFETLAAFQQHNKDKGHVITTLHKNAINVHNFVKNGDVVAEITSGMGNAPETIFNNNTQFSVTLCITNNMSNDILLDNIEGVNRDLNKFVEIVFEREYAIEPTEIYTVQLNFAFKQRRAYRMPLTITYMTMTTAQGEAQIQGFNKQLIFEIVEQKFAVLQPTSPYQRPKPVASDLDESIVPGERPDFQIDFKAAHPLKPYLLTPNYITIFNSGLQADRIPQNLHKLLREINQLLDVEEPENCLTEYNYREMLELLLYLEEHQMKIDIRNYDTETDKLTHVRNNFYELEVPELSENRPSLMIGDSVFVKDIGAELKYEGIVHEKFLDRVRLGFHQKFSNIYIAKKKFAVSFSYNRTTLKVEHQAAFLARHCAKYFFPTQIVPSTNIEDVSINCYNRDINANAQQLQAVKEIIKGSVTNVPYLIFGPPGTGKTMTVVEAILQVRKVYPNSAILVSTPSNSAANLITDRLLKNRSFSEKELLRYISYSYSVSEIPESIKKYCNLNHNVVCHPTMDSLMEFKVIVTTLTTAGRLYNIGIPRKHFSYVFIDEAGHATETETLIPITAALVDGDNVTGRVILAGDPQQLGPIIHSSKAKTYGFGTSMLERLMKTMSIYSRHKDTGYDNRVLTKLLKNYRSHPEIIAFSNEAFYHGELVCQGGDIPNSALGHELLPNKKFPIIFHSVLGIDQREGNSPSFFNIQEIQTVFEYLDKLVGTRMRGMLIKAQDIAVVTPYRKQVQKIRQMCSRDRSGRFDNLEVGSIEKLQGQERLIVIISTVRSKPEFVQHDVKFHLGFLTNPKRMNVALTRAKALLIVIGNPNLLINDYHWGKFIRRCDDNDATTGAEFSLDGDEELLQGFERITLDDNRDDADFGRGNR